MLKVTAYCRVSTDSTDQKNSLANQEQFFRQYIAEKSDWQYITIYVDEGLSGTSTRKREGFNKMLADAHAGVFDLILTKEVSRFSRNTIDTLRYTRELKALGVGVIFINDNIDTRESTDEFRLTIMASCAQEEARKISERVKWGQKRSMENGVIFGQKTLGYRRVAKNKLEIIPEEAQTVQKIFREYIDGKGLDAIAQALGQRDATAIRRILKNEKYCGDLKQKKFITPDFLTHKTKRNKGEEEFITLRDVIPAIIPRATFEAAQAEMTRRAKKTDTRYTNRHAFSGKLKCQLCGGTLLSRSTKKYKRWRCKNAIRKTCSAKIIPQKIIEAEFLQKLKKATDDNLSSVEKFISEIMELLQAQSFFKNDKKKIEARINRLIELRLDGEITKQEFKQKRGELQEKLEKVPSQANIPLDKTAIKARIRDLVTAKVFSEEVAKEVMLQLTLPHNHLSSHLP